jgi:hypothetical protein
LEKSDEREFLFSIKACTNPELLFWIIEIGWNFFVSNLLLQIHRLIDELLV